MSSITTEWSGKLWLLSDNFLHNQPGNRPYSSWSFQTAGIRKMINRIVSFFYIMSGGMHTPMRSVLSLW